jgi:DNA-binding transcriptional regulator YdaS (Cro superfamily)
MDKKTAIEHFGSASALAAALGVSLAAVSQWQKIPLGRQYQLEIMTKGILLADRVRIDKSTA